MDDCETQASHMMASANALNDLYTHLKLADDKAVLDDFVCPKLFAGISIKQRAIFLKGIYHVLGHVDYSKGGVYMFCNTGNAYGAAAGAGVARSLNGHCYAGCRIHMLNSPTPDVPLCSLLEGTKWVSPMTASLLKHPDVQAVQLCNEISNLLVEVTKMPSMDPSMDVGSTLLQIYQGISSIVSLLCHEQITK